MINSSSSDAQAFRVMAPRIDAVRETMPVTGDPLRRADTANLAGQLRELGAVIADLTDTVHHLADGQHANRPDVLRWADAVRPAGHAAVALGIAASRLTLVERPRQPFDDPRVREYDSRVVGDALATADTSLRETASAASGNVCPL